MKNYNEVLDYLNSLQFSVREYRYRNSKNYFVKPMYDAPFYEIDYSDEAKLFIKLLYMSNYYDDDYMEAWHNCRHMFSTTFRAKRDLRKRVNEIKRIIKLKEFI